MYDCNTWPQCFLWLDPAIDNVPALKELLKPATLPLEARAVANPKHPRDDDATLIEAVAADHA